MWIIVFKVYIGSADFGQLPFNSQYWRIRCRSLRRRVYTGLGMDNQMDKNMEDGMRTWWLYRS